MARTTINLKDQIFSQLQHIAKRENRSLPNLIETWLIRHLEEDVYVDEFEMEALRKDKKLQKDLKRGLSDYKAGRGRLI